ncbi:MAG: hypothetical protein HC788_02725 [Sphingopyxis sp.]|nr:hypothetical protein [Sphingopyxis sp.]
MNDAAPAKPGAVESVSALGLMVGGVVGVLASVAALALGIPLHDLAWWLWLVPLWGLIAFPLGWTLRHRTAPANLRNVGRAWFIVGAVPLLIVLAFGKPVQKVMLEKQAATSAEKKGQ